MPPPQDLDGSIADLFRANTPLPAGDIDACAALREVECRQEELRWYRFSGRTWRVEGKAEGAVAQIDP